jgi:hypothetical protein
MAEPPVIIFVIGSSQSPFKDLSVAMHQACPWNGDVTMKFSDLGWGTGDATDRERLNF